MRIKFQGFRPNSAVTLAASQGGITRGPVTVSAWQPASATGTGTFKVYVNQSPTVGGVTPADPTLYQGMEITDGGLVEGVAPLPLMVVVDNFEGFSVNDPRQLYIDVDYGERYDAQYHDPANFPPKLTMPRGSTLGFYVGHVSGHSIRGTDMAGAAVLTPSNPTVQRDVTVTVSDGLQTRQMRFRTRLYHPDVYYTDRDKSVYFPTAPESNRRGIIFFAQDGDFTGALPEQPQTSTQGGIYHYTRADGLFDQFMWGGDQSGSGGPDFPYGTGSIGCIDIRLKGGETWSARQTISPFGQNTRITSWGTGQAILDGEPIREWAGRPEIIAINGFGDFGFRLDNVFINGSDYDVSDVTWREWWNILPYTGKSGTFQENTAITTGDSEAPNWNGDILTNGSGVYAQVIGDTGSELIVRQVVDNAAPDDITAQPAAFTNGDTLTGSISGVTCTFIAAGSRQDRAVRWLPRGVRVLDMRNALVDRCRIKGCAVGVTAIGPGGVLSDTWIQNYQDYGYYEGGSYNWGALSGMAITQPLGYISPPRDFGLNTNIPVAGAREEWNVVYTDEPNTPIENSISHAAVRCSDFVAMGHHYNKMHSYGGHGAAHQPQMRLHTGGAEAEDRFMYAASGNGHAGGAICVTFGASSASATPYTPRSVLLTGNHYLATEISVGALFTSNLTGVSFRNNLLEYPAGTDFSRTGNGFIGFSDAEYTPDPDQNPKSIIIEYNTMVFEGENALAALDVGVQQATMRGTNPMTWRNNAYAIDATKVGSISADVSAFNDNPSDYTADWKPLPTASAYQSAVAPFVEKDAEGTDRPSGNVSKGAFEPT